MRKRPQRVGGTQNGKSGLDSSSYAEFCREHDWHLSFNVWWPHDELIKDFVSLLEGGFQSGGHSGLAGNSNHRYVICQNYHYYLDSLMESFSFVMASSIVQGITLTALPPFSTRAC